MITFEELMARASDATLQDLVGRETVRILSAIDPAAARPERLRELVASSFTPSELLLNQKTREELLFLLPRREATDLASRLEITHNGDVYGALAELRIRRGTKRAEHLLDFFTVEESVVEAGTDEPAAQAVVPGHGLFTHQRTAARKVMRLLEVEPKRALLHMPTGSGKTRTAMALITELLTRSEPALVVWLAHSEELCQQAAEEFTATWSTRGNREVSIQRWWGGYDLDGPAIRDGIIIAGMSKVFSSLKRSAVPIGEIAGRVGFVVMDEAHQAIAPTYQQVLDTLVYAGTPSALLGLTATPGRSWNDISADEQLSDFFYRRRVVLEVEGYSNPVNYLIDEGYLARPTYTQLPYNPSVELTDQDLLDISASLEIPESILDRLAEDQQRNMAIIATVEQLARRHKRILVFAATKPHALVLESVLRARGLDASSITGETPPSERARRIQTYKDNADASRILVNYGVLTTGFDAPQTSCAVIARPTKSLVLYSQMVGRATRGIRAGGNREAEIATVVDSALPGFSDMVSAFENWEDVW